MKKETRYRPGVGYVSVFLSIVLLVAVTSGFFIARADEADLDQSSEAELIKKESPPERTVIYEEDSYYPELPDLELTELSKSFRTWTKREYGVDENPYGIIGSAVVNYYFRTPRNWSVRNTSRRFAPGEDMVIFNLAGESGMWGAIIKLNLKDKSIKSLEEFARYYSLERPYFMALPGDLKSSEVDSKLHLIQGYSAVESDFIEYFESYSSVEIPGGKFASIASYEMKADLGYVVDIYIPVEGFNGETRTIAYAIGKSFKAYRFG